MVFAPRPWSSLQGLLAITRSRACLFPRARVLRLCRTGQPLANNAAAVLPSSYLPWSQHPVLRLLETHECRPPMPPLGMTPGFEYLAPARRVEPMARAIDLTVEQIHCGIYRQRTVLAWSLHQCEWESLKSQYRLFLLRSFAWSFNLGG